MDEKLWKLIVVFGSLSMLAIGGTNVIIPEMHKTVVEDEGWMKDEQFADCFAIAQAAPGPSTLIVTLIGYRVARVPGAFIATFAMLLLPAMLTYGLTRVWVRAKEARWHQAVERGFGPLTVGLVFASGLIIARAADHGWAAYAVTAVTTVIFVKTKVNPLFVVLICGAIGLLEFV